MGVKNNKNYINILGVMCLVLLMLGISYSFFSYKKEGVIENSIKLGSITFKYTEIDNIGNGITITDAFPVNDSEGKILNNEGSYFDFKVESTLSRSDLEYEVVAYPTKDSTLPLDAIKFYLTDVTDEIEKEINNSINDNGKVKTLDEYNDTLIKDKEGKTIYSETILKNTRNYIKKFRTRMWVSEDIDWSDDKYIGKSGSIRVDVYANSDMSMADGSVTTSVDTKIERIVANNKYLFKKVENMDYQYTLTVPYEVDKIDIDVITNNTDATVEVVSINNSLDLQPKENYFKAIVTSSDKSKKNEYILQVIREVDTDNTLFSLRVDEYSLSPVFSSEVTEYELALEADSIEIFATANSSVANIEGIGIKKLDWGENVFNIVVTSQEGLIKIYKIKINNIQPTAPILTGGNENWTSTSQTIKISTEGSAISGVSKYEYYISNNSTIPTDDVVATGTTLNDLTINDEGITYVWYRTVSNNGYKSEWSNYQVVKIDKTVPTITINPNLPSSITKGDSYTILEGYTVNNQLSGGNAICSSDLDGVVTNISELTTTGNHTITCTVTTGSGTVATISKVVEITYQSYSAINLIDNGDFTDGINNWGKVHAESFDVSNGIASIVSPTDTWLTLIGVNNKIIDETTYSNQFYIAISAKASSNVFSYGLGVMPFGNNTYVAPSINIVDDQYTKNSIIVTPSTLIDIPDSYFGIYRNNLETDTNQTLYLDYVIVVDLTKTFGSGNEPNREWCDKHINYFDGTSVIFK